MRLATRVRRLECDRAKAAASTDTPTGPCAVCSPPDDAGDQHAIRWIIEFADPENPGSAGPTHCHACGRRLVYSIEFDRNG